MAYNAPEINPYDPTSPDPTPETPPYDVVISNAIKAAMLGMRVHLPAKIVAVHGNQKVDVQLLLQSRYLDGTVVTIPVIQNVMVQMPVGKDWHIKLPIAVGETGSVLFCDRSLDIWSVSDGGIIDPQDSRAHDISDPIFIPGLVPFSQQTTDTTTDMVLKNGSAELRIQKAGTFKATNGTNELIDLLDQLMDTLINNTFTNTLLGPQPFIASTTVLLTQIRAKLDTLKGS